MRSLFGAVMGLLGLAVIGLGSFASAEGPAVSSLNGKISGFGGATSDSGDGDRGLGGLSGSVTLPVFYSLGLQIDGAYARVGSENFGQTGAHLFWRDPSVGLLGFYAGYARISSEGGQDIGRLGAEAQKFHGNITLDAALGWRFGDLTDKAYGRGRIQYYPIDNLMLAAGYTYEGKSFGGLNLEYQISSGGGTGMSLFADSLINDGSNFTVLGGIRVFFGDDMSLKDRHRRQDPDSYTTYDYQAAQQAAGQAKNTTSPPAACPFKPLPNVCGCSASLPPVWRPMIGYLKQSTVTPVSICESLFTQCQRAGFTGKNPGPASCGCQQTSKCFD